MRHYELMVILDPDLEERTVAPVARPVPRPSSATTAAASRRSTSGAVAGCRYEINKKSEGIYAVVDLQAEPATVKELDRQLNLNEAVLRTKVLRPDQR